MTKALEDRIHWSRQEDVPLTWVHEGKEFSRRLITRKQNGCSFHITTYCRIST